MVVAVKEKGIIIAVVADTAAVEPGNLFDSRRCGKEKVSELEDKGNGDT